MIDWAKRLIATALAQHEARDHMDLWTGTVSAVDTTNKRCDVKLRGESVATKAIPYDSSMTAPAVNDSVYVLARSRSYLVFAKANLIT